MTLRPLLPLLLLVSAGAYAGVFVEPYAGGGYGSWGTNRTQIAIETELHGNSVSLPYGARAGVSYSVLFIGADYQVAQVQWRYTKMPAEPADDNWEGTTRGMETGFGPMLGLKTKDNAYAVWVSIFSNAQVKFNKDMDPSEPPPDYKGTSTNIGISLALSKHIHFGFEYQMKRYKQLTQNGRKIDLPGYGAGGTFFDPMKQNVYMGFISFPFWFFNGGSGGGGGKT